MRRNVLRFLAIALATVVVITNITPTSVYATSNLDSATIEAEQGETNDSSVSANNSTVSDNELEVFGEEGKLNYLYLDSNYIETPGSEVVMVSFGNENTVISKATLVVENYETKEKLYFSSEDTLENMVLFDMHFDAIDKGIYEAVAVSVTTDDGMTKYVQFSKTGMENVYFGVDKEVALTNEESIVLSEDIEQIVETQIVTFEEGDVADTDSSVIIDAVEEALDEAESNVADESIDLESAMAQTSMLNLGSVAEVPANVANGNFVVVLDPGHDSTHAGARANGLNEEDLTLKIANYCKAELEKYAGVTVYMTRSGSSCPYPGTTSTVCNKNRVSYAQSVGADVYVSIHLNSASSTSANGAEVFYPNSNYNASIGTAGANLAKQIQRQLVALGLGNRGIAIRNSADNTLYPDGSLADYYGVIKNSKLAGFPAVIIEHAFLTNASDAAFLSSEANLQKLGVADATGIAEYYGLSEAYSFTSNAPTIVAADNTTGKFTASITGVTPLSTVSKVKLGVWNEENGQDDLTWYYADNKGNGTFSKEISVVNHGAKAGTYQIHAYVVDVKGNSHFMGATTCTITEVKASLNSVNSVVAADEKNVTITATGVANAENIQFAVWSDVNGQDDLKWYTATNNGNGTWSANVKVSDHKASAGTYQVHVYAKNVYNSAQFLKATTFKIAGPTAGVVSFKDVDAGKGAFTIGISGAGAKAGIAEVQVAVWSKADQSNLKWYKAVKQSDGSYAVNVNISEHGYEYGTYQAHVYVKDNNGISAFTAGSIEVKQPKVVVTAIGNATQTQYNVKASNVTYVGGVKGVQVAVWSTANGQDDLIWYSAKNNGSGTWSVNVPISAHKTAGSYVAHVYIVDKNGNMHLGGNTSFNVDKPVAGKITISNVDSGEGIFTVNVAGMNSKSGINEVQVAVWSKADQSNLKWYKAIKQADGSYVVDVDVANHSYEYGIYQVHAYVKDNNGISVLTANTVKMEQPKAVIIAGGNANQTLYNVKASSVAYVGGVKGVKFAVWSNEGGQNDLIWYQAAKQSNGTWSITVPISNHKTAGSYAVHMYVIDKNGNEHFGGSTNFYVDKPVAGKVTISDVDKENGTFKVNAAGMSANSGIAEVQVAVWSKADQSNLRWYVAKKQSDGSYFINVNIANHDYEYGTYQAHVYVKDNNGITVVAGSTVKMEQPKVVMIASGNTNQTLYNIKASNVIYAGGVKGIRIAVWSTEGGQDDLIWYQGENQGGNIWSINVPIANHKTAGKYEAHMYVVDQKGNSHFSGNVSFSVEKPAASDVAIVNKQESQGTFGVKVSGVTSVSGVKEVKVAVWCATNQSDMVWYTASNTGTGTYEIVADVRNHNSNLGNYNAHVYVTAENGVKSFVGYTNCSILDVDNLLYPIMGSTSVTVDQMVAYYNSVTTYPSFYANTEAANIRQFCQIYIEECNKEGVKAEVAFVQAMKETNFLRYGGDVDISQFNFAGIGATGGVPGNSFASVRIGIRAHIQHLKAYASSEALVQECVDPRFKYVTRNTAPYCEWLGIQENPYGKGWATAVNYGYNVVERIKTLKKY